MSNPIIIDGKAKAAQLRENIAKQVADLKQEKGVTPGLAVILVGDDPASHVYVRNKGKACEAAGIASFEIRKPATISQEELEAEVQALNARADVHGILVQLPLPPHINPDAVIHTIAPEKDVDGFHVVSAGKLAIGDQTGFVPCTPYGCLLMLRDVCDSLSGKHAVILGRSNIVGKPMAQLLLQESCTITICHSRTVNLEEEIKRADIVVAAIGKPLFVKGEWIKKGAIVIDVGINRIETDGGKAKLVGDVDFAAASERASAITPVPGGVGPMTIACLLHNTLKAARLASA